VDICDNELAWRARTGDAGAFALLVERHFPSARALAARLCAHPDDVDDIVQEAFLQAFTGLGRLRDPDRFGAWLAGIIRNISRAAARQAPLMLLADWPEDLHPASAQGLVGPRALARPPARLFSPGPSQRPPCGRRGDRQTCARPPGAAKGRCDRRRPADRPPESYSRSARG
jgi:hypothetical protein